MKLSRTREWFPGSGSRLRAGNHRNHPGTVPLQRFPGTTGNHPGTTREPPGAEHGGTVAPPLSPSDLHRVASSRVGSRISRESRPLKNGGQRLPMIAGGWGGGRQGSVAPPSNRVCLCCARVANTPTPPYGQGASDLWRNRPQPCGFAPNARVQRWGFRESVGLRCPAHPLVVGGAHARLPERFELGHVAERELRQAPAFTSGAHRRREHLAALGEQRRHECREAPPDLGALGAPRALRPSRRPSASAPVARSASGTPDRQVPRETGSD